MKVRILSVAMVSSALAAGVWAATPDAHAPAADHGSASAAHAPAAHAAPETTQVAPDDALKSLIEGNERYTSSVVEHPHSDTARRCDTFANGQHPIATILSCADSRAPVELLFDQGIGDVFVIRVAGNVADVDEIGTIEYGAEHLHTPLIVVLGHTKCGAVTAVVQEAKVSKNIAQLVDNIAPAVERARKIVPGAKGDTLVQAAIDANVMQSIADLLSHSDDVRKLVAEGKVKVVGAVYDIHIGGVRWLGEHPNQDALLKGQSIAAAPGQEMVHAVPTAHASSHEPAHDAKPAAHDAPHGTSHDAKPAAHAPAHDEKPAKESAAHEQHSSSTQPESTMPHQNGTLKGMLIPAAFLGGAGLASGAIFHFMKSKPHVSAPVAEPQPAKAGA